MADRLALAQQARREAERSGRLEEISSVSRQKRSRPGDVNGRSGSVPGGIHNVKSIKYE
jgi:hypothetical protein